MDNFRRPTEYRPGYVPCPFAKGRYAQPFTQTCMYIQLSLLMPRSNRPVGDGHD